MPRPLIEPESPNRAGRVRRLVNKPVNRPASARRRAAPAATHNPPPTSAATPVIVPRLANLLKVQPLRSVTHLSFALRHISPSWRNYIHYARVAALEGDRKMQKYVAAFDAMTLYEQRRHWPEDIIEITGVQPGELIGAVCKSLWDSCHAESTMVSSIAQAGMMTSLVKRAKTKDGYKHAELFYRLNGQLPKDGKPPFSPITIYNNPQAVSVQGVQTAGPAGLMPMEQDVMEMDRVDRAPDASDPTLPAPSFLKDKVVEIKKL